METASEEYYEEPWGQLLAIEGGDDDRIPIIQRRFTIGRNKDADHVITDNKCVSGHHCTLICDDNGQTWFHDTSTNGTLVDGKKIHQSKIGLINGMVLNIVFSKDHPRSNLSYKFVDLRNYNNSTDSQDTVGYNEEHDNYTLKRKPTEQVSDEPANKKLAVERELSPPKQAEGSPTKQAEGSPPKQAEGSPPKQAEGSPPKPVLLDSRITEQTVETADDVSEGTANSLDKVTELGSDKQTTTDGLVPILNKKDSFEETLICQICQEILHDCVSLQPCMHCYCGGCYSDWMEYSRECPACRNAVDRISKNHIVNNLVDAYLRANPGKKRPPEDIKELDEKNKITKDMLYPKKSSYKSFSGDEEEEYSDDGSHSNSSDTMFGAGTFPLLITPIFPPPIIHHPVIPVSCRQCPGHTHLSADTPTFVCTSSTIHIICTCCLKPMPDRRTDPDITIPPQKCDVCGKAFCHMYWGCGKFGCTGCLNQFIDIDFNSSTLDYIINDNYYESEILKEYMTEKGMTVKDLLQNCLEKLDKGAYTSSDTRTTRISSLTRTCHHCALNNFKDLAYQYRKEISNEDLPSDVVARADCYYGHNCRTQRHNREHCKRYNHICDQKRY